jgi:uroporphyrinogen decarboxylase
MVEEEDIFVTMTHRERMLTTIQHEIPDRIPVSVICIDDPAPIAAFLGIPSEDVSEALGIDSRGLSAGKYTGTLPPAADDSSVDEWGATALYDYGAHRSYPLDAADSLAAIEAYPWPDGSAYDFAAAAVEARKHGREVALRGPYWYPVFCRACALFGMEEAMVKMMTESAIFEGVLERITQQTEVHSEHFLRACGDDLAIFCLGDDFATQRGLLMDPRDWRRYLKPCYARLFALGKRYGKPVWFHSCGDVTAVLPDLIDIGMDVWETVQLHTLPISAQTLKREYGRDLTFFGGVNTQRLPFISPDEVADETRHCIEMLGQDGGYICGPDHHIKPDVPPANTLALFGTATSFRADRYTCA